VVAADKAGKLGSLLPPQPQVLTQQKNLMNGESDGTERGDQNAPQGVSSQFWHGVVFANSIFLARLRCKFFWTKRKGRNKVAKTPKKYSRKNAA
jgi:hypothetical protein